MPRPAAKNQAVRPQGLNEVTRSGWYSSLPSNSWAYFGEKMWARAIATQATTKMLW
ncbi:hypothetical protein D3C78_1879590 [compost metagenome]